MNNCSKCGIQLELGDKYCSKCGQEHLSSSSSMNDQILSLLKEQKLIEAVKIVRERKGLGLKESKDYVESIARQNGVVVPSASPIAALVFGIVILGIVGGIVFFIVE